MNRRHFTKLFGQMWLGAACTITAGSLPGLALADDKIVIDAEAAHQKMSSGEMTLIDIRRPDEWRDTGVAEGALEITMHDPKGPEGFLSAVLAQVGNDKSVPIGLICASGVRSTFMHRFLTSNGFTNVVNVREGMLGRGRAPGWIKRGLPTKPCASCG